MTVWTIRRDHRGDMTFISYTCDAIEILAPPGNHPVQWADIEGDGLWWQGSWPRLDDTLVDLHPPLWARRVPTTTVLSLLDEGLHEDVVAMMRHQLEDARTLCRPDATRVVDDRRTSRHAWFLMALSAELCRAFPHRDVYDLLGTPVVEAADAVDEAVVLPPHGSVAAPVAEREVRVRVVVLALGKAIWARICGRPVIGTVDVVRPSGGGRRPEAAAGLTPPSSVPPQGCKQPLM